MQIFGTRDGVYANEERPSLCHVDASTCVKWLSWGWDSGLFRLSTCAVHLFSAWAQPYKRHSTNILLIPNAMILQAEVVITLRASRVFMIVCYVSMR